MGVRRDSASEQVAKDAIEVSTVQQEGVGEPNTPLAKTTFALEVWAKVVRAAQWGERLRMDQGLDRELATVVGDDAEADGVGLEDRVRICLFFLDDAERRTVLQSDAHEKALTPPGYEPAQGGHHAEGVEGPMMALQQLGSEGAFGAEGVSRVKAPQRSRLTAKVLLQLAHHCGGPRHVEVEATSCVVPGRSVEGERRHHDRALRADRPRERFDEGLGS